VMAENLRSGLVCDTFMRAPEVQRGMQVAGFRPVQNAEDRVQKTEDKAQGTGVTLAAR